MTRAIERGPMLAAWGELAPRVAALLRARPQFATRLALARPAATHAYATFLLLAPAASAQDEEVAAFLDERHPRDLLAIALPGCPDRLYPLLDRVEGNVRTADFYNRLDAAVRGEFVGAVQGSERINERTLTFVEKLARLDPVVGSAWRALDYDSHLAGCFHTLAVLLRAHGLPANAMPPARAGKRGIYRWVIRHLEAIAVPAPAFSTPTGYTLVPNIKELRGIGRRFNNCLGSLSFFPQHYWIEFLMATRVFLVRDEPALCISLELVGPRLHYLAEILGPDNTPPPLGARAKVEADLRAVGVRLVPMEPISAFSRMSHAVQQPVPTRLDVPEMLDFGEDFAA